MSNPWLSIPLSDYEGHMDAAQQLRALSGLFARALEICQPDTVAVLGIAGGNGLEHVRPAAITRVVGIDINAEYLAETRQRFGPHLPLALELHHLDLSEAPAPASPVAMVHAGLFFEHAGTGRALDNALTLVDKAGHLSVVLQLPAAAQPNVSATAFPSMQTLANHFASIDPAHFRESLAQRQFHLTHEERLLLPTGKGLWLGIFAGGR
jgi:Zn-dependent alcohol dehydrogenase